jgi:hypothetical protein
MYSDRATAAEGSLTYILPLRCTVSRAEGELDAYLRWLAQRVETIVVDASAPAVFARHAAAWGSVVRHVAPSPELAGASGRAGSVLTGVRLASCERLIVAADDVRYDDDGLRRVERALDGADVVRPQNYYDPMPWHARWDTARMLLNRAHTGDLPGTVGVRRSALQRTGGYDGSAVFEHLELVRTVIASGGWDMLLLDVFVPRRPTSLRAFWPQRLRQAYAEIGRPRRLAAQLALLPAGIAMVGLAGWGTLALGAGTAIAMAEAGRRRGKGTSVFPPSTAWFAPAWVVERALCSWLAVVAWLALGGVPHDGTVRRHAATSMTVLEERYAAARRASTRQRSKPQRRRI